MTGAAEREIVRVQVMRPRIKVIAGAASNLEEQLNAALDWLIENGCADKYQMMVTGSQTEGIVVVIEYLEPAGIRLVDKATGQVVEEKSAAGIVTR